MLYPQLLEGDFERLPRSLREFHSAPGGGRATGTVAVRHTNRWLAWMTGFPPAGDGIPLELEIVAGDDQEVWIRRFGGRVRRSVQHREGGLLLEAMGPLRLLFRVFADSRGLRFETERAHLWRIPVPLRVSAEARGNESSWEIEVSVAFIGAYRGALAMTV